MTSEPCRASGELGVLMPMTLAPASRARLATSMLAMPYPL